MDERNEGEQRDDPVESGALEDEGDGASAGGPPRHEEPVESGALEDEPGEG